MSQSKAGVLQTVAEDGLNGVVGRMGLFNMFHQLFVSLAREFTGSTQFSVETLAHVGGQFPLRVELFAAIGTLKT